MSGRFFLIGLDGATFDVLDPLMDQGEMPALRSFLSSGVRANLRTVVPALTPPAWASLVTGRSPGNHGVFDFFTKDSPESHYFHISTAHDVKAETLWSILDRAGLRSTILNFPLTFPAPAIQGNVVPGWMPWRQLRLGCRPEGLYDRIKAIPDFDPKALSLDLSPEAKAVQGCQPEELTEWVGFYTKRERHWLRIVRMLEREDPSSLTAVLFDGVDKIQHLCWRFIDPRTRNMARSAEEEHIRELCTEYFRELDSILGELFHLAGPEDTVLIASDHGFGAQTGTFFVNAWLAKKGYLSWAKGSGPEATGSEDLGMEQLARHVYLLDWSRTRAYVPTPSSNGLYIVPRDGESRAEYERFRARLVEELSEVRDERGRPVVSRVRTKDEIFPGVWQSLAPDIVLELEDGGLVSILASDTVYRTRKEPLGAHRPEGVFLARGPGLRKGLRLGEISILDVAPTVLHALGVPVPRDLEGAVPWEAFNEAARSKGASAEKARPREEVAAAARPTLSKEDEKRLAAHLRALGYIE
jgi:predicted AlkP superfamily phosphohydrolase/phosphomutase